MHTIGFLLHQNELPFRGIFKTINGTTLNPTTFIDPLGKLCGSNYDDLPKEKFELIRDLLDNLYFTAEAMDDLSGDQQLLLEYAVRHVSRESEP